MHLSVFEMLLDCVKLLLVIEENLLLQQWNSKNTAKLVEFNTASTRKME